MCDCVCTLCTIHLSIQSPDSSAKAAIALTLLAVWFVTFAATVAQNRYLYISHLIPQKLLVQAATKEQALLLVCFLASFSPRVCFRNALSALSFQHRPASILDLTYAISPGDRDSRDTSPTQNGARYRPSTKEVRPPHTCLLPPFLQDGKLTSTRYS
jgi:uncharacterized membrane protein